MRRALLLVGLLLLIGCESGSSSTDQQEPPATKMEEIVGSWSGDDLTLTVKDDGSCSSLYTAKQANGQATDWMAKPKLKQVGPGYVVPIMLNENSTDDFIIDVSDDGKTMTLMQKGGTTTFSLSKE